MAGIGAIVLAAGLSNRMGRSKLLLPWRDTTIIGQVIHTLLGTSLDEIWVVTGKEKDKIEAALAGKDVRYIYNPRFEDGEMLHSVQTGLSALSKRISAALIVLGDQPLLEPEVVIALKNSYKPGSKEILIPSFQMKRGHPWLVDRHYWPEILLLQSPATLRDFLSRNNRHIHYINVNSTSILEDIDTPLDYEMRKPKT